jgi:hypothetical protein
MSYLLFRTVNLPALAVSVFISFVLLSGLNAGFAPIQEAGLCIVQLPPVTVHGKRLTPDQAVVARSEAATVSTSSNSSKL